ncbi:DUF2786 domain-containing protein [Phreatobacter sp. HK31-P]
MDDRKKLLARIKAILLKTVENGCTEAEAMAAMQKAGELMDLYNVSDGDLAFNGESVVTEKRKRDAMDIATALAMGVASFTETTAWRSLDGHINYVGLESDVLFAGWLLDMLEEFVRREFMKYIVTQPAMRTGGERKHFQRSFIMGATGRISTRLYELAAERRKARGTGKSLIVSKQSLILAELKRLGITLGGTRRQTRTVDRNAHGAGRAAGDRASFSRPVGQEGGVRAIRG